MANLCEHAPKKSKGKQDNVTNIDKQRPHFVITGLNDVHVIPESVFYDVIKGKLKPSNLEGLDDFLPTIFSEWING